MRHTSLLGQPKPVPLLPSGMVSSASLRLLVPATGFKDRLATRLTTARPRAVPLSTIAVRAHDHLASTSIAAQQSSVARGAAAFPTEQRAECKSSPEDLYLSRGTRSRGGSGFCFQKFRPAAVLFPGNGLSPTSFSASPASIQTTHHDCSTTTARVHHTKVVAVSHTTD